MPGKYNKTFKKKKGGYARKGAKRGAIYGAAAGQLWKDVKFLKDMINVERKVYDIDLTAGALATNVGSTSWMSGIATGTGFNQRTGMVVKASSFSLKGTIECNASAASPTQVRIIIYINKSLNQGVLPGTSDILQSTGSSGIGGPITPYQLNNVGDFTVLMDRKYTVDLVQRNQVNVNFRCKLGHHIRWETTGDLIANTESGHIFMLVVSDQSTNQPSFQYYSRLRYVDN